MQPTRLNAHRLAALRGPLTTALIAFRQGVCSGQKINAAVATMFDDGAQDQEEA